MKVEYTVEFTIISGTHSSAIVLTDEDLMTAVVDSVIQDISTDIEVTINGVTMHLAAWMDPEHWSEDWEGIGEGFDPCAHVEEALVDGV